MARSRSMFCLILTAMVPAVFARVHFTEQPVGATVKEGAVMATIACRVAELDPSSQVLSFERERRVITDEGTVRRDILESLGLDAASYKVRLDIHAEGQFRYYSLSVESPTRNDTGRFRCVVCSRNETTFACNTNDILASSDEVALTVNYPPADHYPVCAAQGSSPTTAPNASFVLLVEGEPAEFSCASEIASPPVELTWTRNGTEVGKDQAEVSDKAGVRTSRLKISPARGDNGTVLTCTLTSDAYNETERSCSLPPLSVAPRPTDKPGDIFGTVSIVVITILAVLIVLLLVAIIFAAFMKRKKKKNQESRGHTIEYEPAGTEDANTEDAVKLRANRDLQ